MSKYIIYTDGASRGNPGPGGFAAIIFEGDSVKEIGGEESKTTNNRMEMRAAIAALRKVPESSEVEVHTDSSYLLNGITKWVYAWQANDWKTKAKDDVLNKDLWQDLMYEVSNRDVEWKLVSGHSGHSFNDRCDQIATAFADGKQVELFSGTKSDYEIREKSGVGVNRSKVKAYSYISMVGGKIETHQTWAECERKVKGKEAKFRKALSAREQEEIVESFKKQARVGD